MLEEHVLVTEVASFKLRLELEVSNVDSISSRAFDSIDSVENSACFNGGKLVLPVLSIVIAEFSLDGWVRVEEELEGELGVRDSVSILINLGEVRESNISDVRSTTLEF